MAAKKKRKGEKYFKKSKSLKIMHAYACPSQNVIKRDANGKKGELSHCKRPFD